MVQGWRAGGRLEDWKAGTSSKAGLKAASLEIWGARWFRSWKAERLKCIFGNENIQRVQLWMPIQRTIPNTFLNLGFGCEGIAKTFQNHPKSYDLGMRVLQKNKPKP